MVNLVKKQKEQLRSSFLEVISAGLKRHAVQDAAKWAETYRIMATKGLNGQVKTEPWSFKYHPWLKGMHNSTDQRNVGQKAAQMGFTETLLNLAFYSIDVLGRDVLYVLPNKNPECGDFSSGRFDAARAISPHLMNLFSDTDNIGHKRAGHANFYIRGSNSRSGLKSLPISTLLMDEVAEFVEENIPLAFERTSGQLEYLIWLVSTPTLEGHGISIYYNQSDKQSYVFRCPSCSKFITFKFPESIVVTAEDDEDPNVANSYYKCYECNNRLPDDRDAKAVMLETAMWVPQFKNKEYKGFSVNQMYSPVITPKTMALSSLRALKNPAEEVEFYNSKLGVSHEVKGARVSDEDIQYCMVYGPKNRRGEFIPDNPLITMGVDVGKWLHYVIMQWKINDRINASDIHSRAFCVVADHGKVQTFDELSEIMNKNRVLSCVVDRNPETRKAIEFANQHYGRVKLCLFSRGITGRMFSKPKHDDDNLVVDEHTISVDRTSWLDQSMGRFINKTVSLPLDVNMEYRDHLKALTKTYVKDADGNPVSKYLTQLNAPDHYAFAQVYGEMALSFVALGGNSDLTTSFM